MHVNTENKRKTLISGVISKKLNDNKSFLTYGEHNACIYNTHIEQLKLSEFISKTYLI